MTLLTEEEIFNLDEDSDIEEVIYTLRHYVMALQLATCYASSGPQDYLDRVQGTTV